MFLSICFVKNVSVKQKKSTIIKCAQQKPRKYKIRPDLFEYVFATRLLNPNNNSQRPKS